MDSQSSYICWLDNDGSIIGQRYNGYYNQNAQQERLGVADEKYSALLSEKKDLEDTCGQYYDALVELNYEFPKSPEEIAADQAKVIAECKTQLANNAVVMAEMLAEIKALRGEQTAAVKSKGKGGTGNESV